MGPWLWGKYGDGEEETVNLCFPRCCSSQCHLVPESGGGWHTVLGRLCFVDSSSPLIQMMGKAWWAELTVFIYLLVC